MAAWPQILAGRFTTRERKGELQFQVCPWCGNPKWNFEVNLTTGLWHCWACKTGGGSLKRLMKELGITYGGPWPSRWQKDHRVGIQAAKQNDAALLPAMAKPVLAGTSNYAEVARGYLRHRGMSDEEMIRYDMHYCGSGHYKGRVVFPFREEAELVYWTARTFADGYPKYLHPSGRKIPVTYQGKDQPETVVLCEGPFDGVSIHRSGRTAMMLLGQDFTAHLAESDRVFVMLDEDAQRRALLLYQSLAQRDMDVRVCLIKGDPGDMSTEQIEEVLEHAAKPSLRQVVTQLCVS